MRTVALDLGARKISYSEAKQGRIVERATARGMGGLVRQLGPNTPPAEVVFEACREGWHVARQLQGWGHEALMLDTTRSAALGIGRHGRKNDRIDADTMALALEKRQIPLAHILSAHRQELRYQLSVRRGLVETRAQYVTTIREIVRARGGRIPSCAAEEFWRKLQQAPLEEATRLLITPMEGLLRPLNERIDEVERKLVHLCAQEPVITRLMTTPGVAMIVAAAFVSVIDEARRFRRAHEVESYLGLVPSEDTTGGKRRLGAISKQGNSYLRALLVQASWCILRQDDTNSLALWGRMVAQRRGKRIAVVALARRLTGILWAMWRDQSVFDSARVGRSSAAGLKLHAQDVAFQAAALARATKKVPRLRSIEAAVRWESSSTETLNRY
jgi:transposase